MSYYDDPRTAGAVKPPVLYLEADDGRIDEIPLPMRWVVCNVCRGNGTHVNPSIDANGISGQEFHDDPDFAESYYRGDYDQVCNGCLGRTTIPAVDWDALDPDQAAAYRHQLTQEAADRAQELAELRAGA